MHTLQRFFLMFCLVISSLHSVSAASKKILWNRPIQRQLFDGTVYNAHSKDPNKEIYYQLARNGTIVVATKKTIKRGAKPVSVYTCAIQKPSQNIGLRQRYIVEAFKGKLAKEKFEEFSDFCNE